MCREFHTMVVSIVWQPTTATRTLMRSPGKCTGPPFQWSSFDDSIDGCPNMKSLMCGLSCRMKFNDRRRYRYLCRWIGLCSCVYRVTPMNECYIDSDCIQTRRENGSICSDVSIKSQNRAMVLYIYIYIKVNIERWFHDVTLV